jgi:Fe-S cluster assembly iron-binding protein IscA
MSENEIDRILDKLDRLAEGLTTIQTNQKWVMQRQEEQQAILNKLSSGGCARYSEHVDACKKIEDHESRLDSLEGDRKILIGAASVTGVGAGGVLTWLNKIFGGQ